MVSGLRYPQVSNRKHESWIHANQLSNHFSISFEQTHLFWAKRYASFRKQAPKCSDPPSDVQSRVTQRAVVVEKWAPIPQGFVKPNNSSSLHLTLPNVPLPFVCLYNVWRSSHLMGQKLCWFVGWNHGILWLSVCWECHHPNWRTHSIIFQRGRSTTKQLMMGQNLWNYPLVI